MNDSPVVLQVAIPLPLTGGFDYLWTPPTPPPRPGCRVRVPFGNRQQVGVVLAQPAQPMVAAERLKPVLERLDDQPVFDAELLETLSWCSEYYHHPIGEVLSQALPGRLRRGHTALPTPEQWWRITPQGLGLDVADLRHRAPRQAEALEILAANAGASTGEFRRRGIAGSVVRRLAEKGWAQPFTSAAQIPSSPRSPTNARPPQLTADQQRAVSAISSEPPRFRAVLLHGVTGSGKTEVFMRLIARELDAGRQTLLLVPEIGLTPQLVSRLGGRFGDDLAIMHSGLAAGERLKAWGAARSGTAKLIVGTRSAAFAPLPNPGLIIVDEEHDPSYKQQEGFRYSARDLAVVRARRLDVPVLLASATPSLESYHNALRGRYELLRMPQRIGAAGQPDIRIIDLNRHASRNGLSTPLVSSIEDHLSRNRQVLLFLNRRGFAPALLCPECGAVEECPRCDARMTIHAASGRLRCHHCGSERTLSWACGQCGTERVAVGAGTQRVSAELRAIFPTARIARLDRDVTSRKGALAEVLAEVERGDAQILVGTQMLTKGHDFPMVTLVGVLNADQGLFGTDFRSSERLAQTILQVAGRSGRREQQGDVVIQTHYPDHPLLACLIRQDYEAFATLALREREEANWPPFAHLVLCRAEASQRAPALKFLHRIGTAARSLAEAVDVLGPAPASMERRGGRYRAQLLLRAAHRGPMHELLDELLRRARSWPEARRVRWAVDVDPAEL